MTAMNQMRIGSIRRTGNRATTRNQEQTQCEEQADQQWTDLAETVARTGQAVDLDVDLAFGVRIESAFIVRVMAMLMGMVAVLVSHRLLPGPEVPMRMCAAQPHR